MDNDDIISEIIRGLVQIAPPTAVSGLIILGIPVHDWVCIGTIVYTIVGIATLIKKHWIDNDNKRK